MKAQILVVDDEKTIRWSLHEHLTSAGYQVTETDHGANANNLIASENFDLVLLDQRLPDMDGLALLRQVRERFPELPVVMITAYSSIDNAVEAMKAGAFDYITKPFNMDELAITVRRALEATSLRDQLQTQISQQRTQFSLANIIGQDPKMTAIKELLIKIAQSEATTVLLLGESGTGKDLFAKVIHYESARADKPFMNITCSALPEGLLESELFGHEKGAFTDAKNRKKGLFELGHGGTVFMDEIADMPPALQAKLLRVLEEKSFRRVGSITDITVDVRVIASTNRDLATAMQRGEFRQDLYYRLSVVPILIPPLRDRPDDIPLIADHFLQLFNREFHRERKGFSPSAYEKMQAHDWPGNVRELRNVIERAMLLSASRTVDADDIVLGRPTLGDQPPDTTQAVNLPAQGCNLLDVEKALVIQALERTAWNQSKACELLGITRDQIRSRIAKFNLDKNGQQTTV